MLGASAGMGEPSRDATRRACVRVRPERAHGTQSSRRDEAEVYSRGSGVPATRVDYRIGWTVMFRKKISAPSDWNRIFPSFGNGAVPSFTSAPFT